MSPGPIHKEYIDQVKHLVDRVESIVEEMRGALEDWSLEPVVRGLMAMRGISLVASMTISLVPSMHSSGEQCNRGGITKTGNSHFHQGIRRPLER